MLIISLHSVARFTMDGSIKSDKRRLDATTVNIVDKNSSGDEIADVNFLTTI